MNLGNMHYTLVKMNINSIQEKENPFFKRRDLRFIVEHSGSPTPSKNEVVKELSQRYNVDELQVHINYIFSKKGLGESFVSSKILEEKPKIEIKEQKSEVSEAQSNTET